jgi:hypothetical protein
VEHEPTGRAGHRVGDTRIEGLLSTESEPRRGLAYPTEPMKPSLPWRLHAEGNETEERRLYVTQPGQCVMWSSNRRRSSAGSASSM